MKIPVGEMTCRELVALVTEYLEGGLSTQDVERFEQHVSDCPYCRAYLEQMRQTIATLGRLSEESLDPRARDDLLERFNDWHRQSGSRGSG